MNKLPEVVLDVMGSTYRNLNIEHLRHVQEVEQLEKRLEDVKKEANRIRVCLIQTTEFFKQHNLNADDFKERSGRIF